MGNAFKCDACGDFHEGSPTRTYMAKSKPSPLSDERVWGRYDLCSSCYDDLQDELDQFVGDGE